MLLYKVIDRAFKSSPDKMALVCDGRDCTYLELFKKMNEWAGSLLALGVGKGDRVALFMKNSVELVQLYLACFRIGAIAVPLNTRYKMEEAEYALKQSGSKILISSKELYSRILNIETKIPTLKSLFLIDGVSEDDETSWHRATSKRKDLLDYPEIEMSDPAIIIYTSGSTGRPKGAVHTHHSVYNLIKNRKADEQEGQYDVTLAATQISHIAGFGAILLPTLYSGGTVVMLKEFEPASYIEHLKQYRPTYLVLLPTELLEVLEHPNHKDADFSNLKSLLISGDKVPHHIYELFHKHAGFDLLEGCGMTECEGYCLQPEHDKKKAGSIGKPIFGVQMRIVDDKMNSLLAGEVGEITIKSESLISHYWNNKEATEMAFVDGWFRTGDLAYKDEDGYYHFVGRIKEIIIRGGSNIAPGEVENVFDDHPNVEECGVVGFPDDHYGSIVGIFIVPRKGTAKLTIDELKEFAADKLADYKIPEKWIFLESLPKNPVGKIDRKKLHEMAKA